MQFSNQNQNYTGQNNNNNNGQATNIAFAAVQTGVSRYKPNDDDSWWLYVKSFLLIVVILALSCVILSMYWAYQWYRKFPTANDWNNVLLDEHQELLRMMDCIHTTLDRHSIRYWIHGGTLLGAVRENKIIDWDDDMDLVVVVPRKKADYELFKERWKRACDELESDGIAELSYCPTLVSVHQLVSTTFPKRHPVHIDVMFYETAVQEDKLIYHSRSWVYRAVASEEWWYEEEVTPLKKYNLNGHEYWGPRFALDYLSRAYPKSQLFAKVQVPHIHAWFPSHTPWSMIASSLVGSYPLSKEVLDHVAVVRQQENQDRERSLIHITTTTTSTTTTTTPTTPTKNDLFRHPRAPQQPQQQQPPEETNRLETKKNSRPLKPSFSSSLCLQDPHFFKNFQDFQLQKK